MIIHPLQLNIGQLGLQDIGHDLNVEPVWIQGITGCNSIVAIVDDGKTLVCEQCSVPFRQQEHSAATYKCVDMQVAIVHYLCCSSYMQSTLISVRTQVVKRSRNSYIACVLVLNLHS